MIDSKNIIDEIPLLQDNEVLVPMVPQRPKWPLIGVMGASINWKVKNGSIVRTGELIAIYAPNPTSALSNTKADKYNSAIHKGYSSKNKANVGGKLIRPRKRPRVVLEKVKPAAVASNVGSKGEKVKTKFTGMALGKNYFKKTQQRKQPNEIEEIGLAKCTGEAIPVRASMDGFLSIFYPQKRRQTVKVISPDNDDVIVFVCGRIESCSHEVVLDGLCTVCGLSIKANPNLNINTHQNPHRVISTASGNIKLTKDLKRDSLTVSGGITIEITKGFGKTLSSQSSKTLIKSRKLNLVLDLDHTLLHATADSRAVSWKCDDLRTLLLPCRMEPSPQVKQLTQPHGYIKHYIKLRPHVAKFLNDVIDKFEITIYTAAIRDYAHKIADLLCRHIVDYRLKGVENSKDDKDEQKPNIEGQTHFCLDEEDLLALRHEVFIAKRHVQEQKEYIARLNKKVNVEKNINDNIKPTKMENKQDIEKEGLDRYEQITAEEASNDCKSTERSSIHKGTSKLIPNKFAKHVSFGDISDNPCANLEKLQKKLRAYEALEEEAMKLRKKIFGNRVVSRTDVIDLGHDVKSLKRVFPCGGMLAVIVDDREDVWANAKNNVSGRKGEPPDNLLLVQPYQWKPFMNFADVNNSAGEDISNQSKDSNDERVDEASIEKSEVQLLWTGDILTRLHDKFYSNLISESERMKLTVPSILRQMRKDILGGNGNQAKVILSGLVPLNVQKNRLGNIQYPRPPVVRYVEELGAKVLTGVSDEVTHVIAARDGTEKINRAKHIPGCAIVKPKWLMECYWSISRRRVQNYLIAPPPSDDIRKITEKLLLSGSDSSEEEDDDFLAEFGQEES